jgi:hypothetical protein
MAGVHQIKTAGKCMRRALIASPSLLDQLEQIYTTEFFGWSQKSQCEEASFETNCCNLPNRIAVFA